VYSATQKCLSCPPGLAPASFSERALARVARRRTPVASWYFDVGLLGGYYGERRVYHHTAPVGMIAGIAEGLRVLDDEGPAASCSAGAGRRGGSYGERRVYRRPAPVGMIAGIAEGLRVLGDEGPAARFARHADAAARLLAGLEPLGFEPLVPAGERLPMLS